MPILRCAQRSKRRLNVDCLCAAGTQQEQVGEVTIAIYRTAALAEIAGCFAFWAVMRLNAPIVWIVPGVLCLIAFAWLL